MDSSQVLLSEEQIRKRVAEMAAQISADAGDHTLMVVAVLDNGFVFMSDLVRRMTCPVICQFVTMETRDTIEDGHQRRNVVYTPLVDLAGKDVLLVDAILQTGVTLEHLVQQLLAKGARSVKTAVLIDKPEERRVAMKPDYSGFAIEGKFLVGYGLGHRNLCRNLPYVADIGAAGAAPAAGSK